jgi:hypothetical protein
VAELDDGDSYEFVKALTDVYRLHMFDVLMQYRAIFFDAPQVGPAAGTRARGEPPGRWAGQGSWPAGGSSLRPRAQLRARPPLAAGWRVAPPAELCEPPPPSPPTTNA